AVCWAAFSGAPREGCLAEVLCVFTEMVLHVCSYELYHGVAFGSKFLTGNESDREMLQTLAKRIPLSGYGHELRRAIARRSAEHGKSEEAVKQEAVMEGLVLAVGERESPQRLRFGKEYVTGKDGTPLVLAPVDLPAEYYERWLHHQARKAAEAGLLNRPYPAPRDDDGGPLHDALDQPRAGDESLLDNLASTTADNPADALPGDDEQAPANTGEAQGPAEDDGASFPGDALVLGEVLRQMGLGHVTPADAWAKASPQQRDILVAVCELPPAVLSKRGRWKAVAGTLGLKEAHVRGQMRQFRPKFPR
nr:hypothetical protein [Dehalococcoidales bacterium]